MKICAIDPGTDQSAIIVMETPSFAMHMLEIRENEHILDQLRVLDDRDFDILLIERVACYGMPVGREIFETCFWIGRFLEAWSPGKWQLVSRSQVKNTLCHFQKARDSNVNQSVRDIMATHFGLRENKLKGTKKIPGPLYGIKSHMWQALALALAWTIENRPDAGFK